MNTMPAGVPSQMPSQPHCRRCQLPSDYTGVRLDASGICNRCRTWDDQASLYGDFDRHQPLLTQRLEATRGRYHYDAAVGLSGGKDSTYVLHRMTHSYGANLLAITLDNGFLSDYAWQNIRTITRATGIDHLVYRPDWDAMRELYRVAVRRFGDPCFACSVGGYVLSIRGCHDLRIPYFVHGRSPMQMFRDLYPGTRDPGLGILRANLRPYDAHALGTHYGKLIRRLRLLLFASVRRPALRRRITQELFGAGVAGAAVVPEFLAFFLYEPYDEEAIKQYLESFDSGYARPDGDAVLGHGDCLIHDAADYLFQLKYGVPRVLPDVAAMVRRGDIAAEELTAIVAANTPSEEQVEASVRHLLERIEMSRKEFDAIVQRLKSRAQRKKRSP